MPFKSMLLMFKIPVEPEDTVNASEVADVVDASISILTFNGFVILTVPSVILSLYFVFWASNNVPVAPPDEKLFSDTSLDELNFIVPDDNLREPFVSLLLNITVPAPSSPI